jgi:hypothetical protein
MGLSRWKFTRESWDLVAGKISCFGVSLTMFDTFNGSGGSSGGLQVGLGGC